MTKREQLNKLKDLIDDCDGCDCHENTQKKVLGEGSVKAKIMFLGEAAGREEAEAGRPFIGRAGKLLTRVLHEDTDLKREEVYICNMLKCRPVKDGKDRPPTADEMDICFPFLTIQMKIIKPKIIVTLGNVPTKYLLKTATGITRLHGEEFDYNGTILIPCFHPAYILRQGLKSSNGRLFRNDLKKVVDLL